MIRLLVAILAMIGTPAYAACSDEPKAPFRILGWSAKKVDEGTVNYHLKLQSLLAKKARMLSGYVSMEDALGEDMGAFMLPKDASYPAKADFEMDVKVGIMVVPRALTVNPQDVKTAVCVKAVVYDDGTKESFGE